MAILPGPPASGVSPIRLKRAAKTSVLVTCVMLCLLPVLPDESPAVRVLLARYGKRMGFVGACPVRMTELYRERMVIAADTEDIGICQRLNRKAIPLIVP
jgi:hypothetical protein